MNYGEFKLRFDHAWKLACLEIQGDYDIGKLPIVVEGIGSAIDRVDFVKDYKFQGDVDSTPVIIVTLAP